MKPIFLIIFWFCVYSKSLAQHSVISTKLTTYLFVGYENQVSVSYPGLECQSISLKSYDCEIIGVGCDYKIKPKTTGLISLYVFNKLTKKNIDTLKLSARTMPQPELQIGSGEGQEKLIRRGPIPYFRCNDFDLDLKVTEFDMQIWRDTTLIYEGKNVGSGYSNESVNAINSARPGDRLVIIKAQVVASNGLQFFLFGNWTCGIFNFY